MIDCVGIESNRERMNNFLRDRVGMMTILVKSCIKSKVGPQEVQKGEREEVWDMEQDEVLEVGQDEVQ